MKKFKCLRCGFETDRKYNFVKHLNRKFKCEPKINDIDIKIIMKKNNIKVNDKKEKRILFVQNVINHLLEKIH